MRPPTQGCHERPSDPNAAADKPAHLMRASWESFLLPKELSLAAPALGLGEQADKLGIFFLLWTSVMTGMTINSRAA